ncbi:MAG: hypothetical protein B0D92_00180 [Spirochaeta sp. LUC14_002_19_P3]|nr:MAG: hypothetical protein B0D92_00180 [Spirochaeta sp. LUC14_002_19_P3]
MEKIIAVIDIGSSAVRLLVAQQENQHWKLLDKAEQPLALGKNLFHRDAIDRHTINRTVEILKGFQELMQPYGADRVEAIGTSRLRESKNWEMFIDRIYQQTGINVKVIDALEANQLAWTGVQNPLQAAVKNFKKQNILIMEVGAGHTDLMLLQQGSVAAAQTLPIGTLRYKQQIDEKFGTDSKKARTFIRNHASRIVRAISYELNLDTVSRLLIMGSGTLLAAEKIGSPLTENIMSIPRKKFEDFVKGITALSPEEIHDSLHIPWSEAELLYPALVILNTFVEYTRADEILVPSDSIRQSMLLSYAADKKALREIFSTQTLSSARRLMKHYHVDKEHGEFVREQAVKIFSALTKELGLDSFHQLLLETAALLHDIGNFISHSSHHKHSQYIIQNSDIFGLSAADKELVSQIARYHRRAKPQLSHTAYTSLSHAERIAVQKLAAILRVADALDRSHTQSAIIEKLEIQNDQLIIFTAHPGDLALEKLSLVEKGDLFEEVFGLKPILQYSDPALSGASNEH